MVGQTISHYKITKKSAKAGWGQFFWLKTLPWTGKLPSSSCLTSCSKTPAAKKSFLREAKSAAALDHLFICKIYETGDAENKTGRR